MKKPKVDLVGLPKEVHQAFKIIERFARINQMELEYKFTLDFTLDCYGLYDPAKPYEIRVNPYHFRNVAKEEPHAPFYTSDFSLMGVCVHEFCHLFDDRTDLLKSYIKDFPERLVLNQNSTTNRAEELAELMSLFVLNPYFLKIINFEVFDFMSQMIKSPSQVTEKSFLSKYKRWNKAVKTHCKETWGVYPWGESLRRPG